MNDNVFKQRYVYNTGAWRAFGLFVQSDISQTLQLLCNIEIKCSSISINILSLKHFKFNILSFKKHLSYYDHFILVAAKITEYSIQFI